MTLSADSPQMMMMVKAVEGCLLKFYKASSCDDGDGDDTIRKYLVIANVQQVFASPVVCHIGTIVVQFDISSDALHKRN